MNKDTLNFFIIFLATFTVMQLSQYFFYRENKKEIIIENLANQDVPVDFIDRTLVETFNINGLTIEFNKKTGQIVNIQLNDFFVDNIKTEKISTLFKKTDEEQTLNSDIIILNHQEDQPIRALFDSVNILFNKEKNQIQVNRFSKDVLMTEIYQFDPALPYEFNKETTIKTLKDQYLYLYTEFKNSNQATITGTEEGAKMFQGASFHTENTKFKRVPFNQFHKKSFSEISKSGGWFAVSQRYFASAISLNYAGKFYTKFVPYHSTCLIGHLSDKIKLDTNQSITFNQKVYSGPAKKELLKKFASSFEFVIDYGFFWPVCAIILSILEFIHLVIYNWGLAIVFATISIRLLLLGLTTKSIKITKKMQELQPKLEAIKKLYPDDQVLLSQEMMAMYKKEGINPIIGFLVPIITALIQIPIFIAFYSVLMETVSLRQAPFISWITDLSLKDSFYVIPVFVTATSYFQQTLTPKPQDETMAMMFKIMPFFLGAICINLPAGLGLYWITNNLISIIQAWSTKYGSLADRT